MTEKSIPWAGKVLGDAGPYAFDEWSQIWRDIFGVDEFIAERSGVIPGQNPSLATTAGGTPFLVGAQRAFVDGTWYESDESISLAIPTPAGSTRPDLITLRKSGPDQTVRLFLLQGVEGGAQPPDPVQSAGSTWDMPLVKLSTTTGGVITAAPAMPMFPLGPGGRLGYSIVEVLEDFMGLFDDIAGNGLFHASYAWDVTITGTGAVIFTNGEGAAIGMIGLSSGVTSTGAVLIKMGPETGGRFDAGWDIDLACRIKDAAAPTEYEWSIGLREPTGAALDTTDGIYVRADHGVAEANWFGVVRKDSSETVVDLGALSDDNWHTIEARKKGQAGSESVQWYVDGVASGAAVTTNVPGTGDFLIPGGFLVSSAAGAQDVEIDFINTLLKKTAANHDNPATIATRSRLYNVIA